MADPDVTMKGILGVNDTAPPNENTGYYLDHVAMEVDMSEIEGSTRASKVSPSTLRATSRCARTRTPTPPSAGSSKHIAPIRTWEVAAGACPPFRRPISSEGSASSVSCRGADLAIRPVRRRTR